MREQAADQALGAGPGERLVGVHLIGQLLVVLGQRVVAGDRPALEEAQRLFSLAAQRCGTHDQAHGQGEENGDNGDQVIPEIDHYSSPVSQYHSWCNARPRYPR